MLDAHSPDLGDESRIGEHDLTRWHTPLGRGLERRVREAQGRPAGVRVLVLALLVGLAAVVALSAAAAFVYEAVAHDDGVEQLDHPVLRLALEHRSSGLDRVVSDFSDIGGPVGMPVLALVLVLVAALTWRTWVPVVMTVVAAGGSLAMTVVGKHEVGRVRPPLVDAVPPYEHSPSFPSGHTLNTTVVITVLAYLLLTHLRRRGARAVTVVAAALWIAAMGLSRVFLGHHWLTDVLCGWLLGLAWALVLVLCHRLWLTHRHAARAREGRGAARRSVGARHTG